MADPLLCLGMGLTSIFSEGLYAATTFGPAITFNIGWQICYMLGLSDGRLTEVTLNMAYAEVCSGALQVVLLRRSVSLPLVAAIVIPGCGFLVFGQLLMLHIEGGFTEGGAWLKRSLGGVLLLMFAQRILALALAARRRPAEPDLQGSGRLEPPPLPPAPMAHFFTWRVQLSTFWWFGLSGVVGGLTSVQGPPIMMWVSIHAAELNFDAWRASNAVLRVGINITRLSIFALRGRVHIDETYPLALSMIGGGCVGLLVGNRAAFLFRDTATLQVRRSRGLQLSLTPRPPRCTTHASRTLYYPRSTTRALLPTLYYPLLQAATLVFLLCGAVLMEAAGFDDAVQERSTFAVAGCAALAALLALLRCAWRRASRRIVHHYTARSEALLPVGSLHVRSGTW